MAWLRWPKAGMGPDRVRPKLRRNIMKAALVFAGSGPIVILTSYPSLSDPGLLRDAQGAWGRQVHRL